jgi:uncharacterized damage-inducible protein DinB
MQLKELFLQELELEAKKTRILLSRVPSNKPDFKPHPKSMELQRLARHIAELPRWATVTLTTPELDFAKGYTPSPPFTTAEALIIEFDSRLGEARSALEQSSDEDLLAPWTMRNGDHVFFTRARHLVIRDMVFSHLIHHRAQLGVYLRLLDVPLPQLYGPTADEH